MVVKKMKKSVKDIPKPVKDIPKPVKDSPKQVKEGKLDKKIKEKDTNKQKELKDSKKEPPKLEKKPIIEEKKPSKKNKVESPKLLINKLRNYSKQLQKDTKSIDNKINFETPKKVKFVLKNNSMQKPVDYYKSVRQSPSIPFDSSKKPNKTNLKPSSPSPINPFFKKKLRMKH